MDKITGGARAQGGAVSVEVLPGGALASLVLTRPALKLGPRGLADAILAAVAEATAVANQRTRHALRAELAGMNEHELATLGLDSPDSLTERAESTTPESWRTS
jgi:DNA-binding protein YbaB